MSILKKVFNPITFIEKNVPIEKVNKGDFFKRISKTGEGKEIYRNEGYDRYNKKYCGQANSDINKQIYIKKGTLVKIGFDF